MVLQRIYDLSFELEQLVSGYTREARDPFLAELQQVLDQREGLLNQLPASPSEAERELGKRVQAINRRIDGPLKRIKQEIARDMNQFRQRKQTVNRYRNPYTGPTKDGMFLDKRE
ncbi:flagellar protein FliT [Sporolactobacillus inulinus]|uniref:Flagellar protein FliT n=1 Tax=Sporolactobacillus inulinus CASD TaxID=1069536 RepID=A0A0U1QPU0_9BACL|nr:flagellar protein FliT [Sporolactobacillus inulinus]KLI02821.1 hypothetical protein SINU_06045 [Sporolactobacillus inulinus CASD]